MAPVSVAEVKAYLRIAHADEDAVLIGFIASAAELCEAFTGRVLLAREVVESVAAGGWQDLALEPVRAILSVERDGQPLPLDLYDVDVGSDGTGMVRVAGGAAAVVRYSAGLAAAPEAVPESLKQGILRLASHLYTHRSDAADAGPPAAVTALWRPWRRLRLAPRSAA